MPVCRKEGRLDTSRDPLLHDLIRQEQRQADRVAAARAEAEQIVEKAEAEAAKLLERSRAEHDAAAAASLVAARQEADAERQRIVAAASERADALRARADANHERAVALVLGQVLP
jgi:V/A-type H+/Na+-transporting ATPase subunit G/H